MTTDIELITAAARSRGYTTDGEFLVHGVSCKDRDGRILIFNPLVSRGDAFELLVHCDIDLSRNRARDSITATIDRLPSLHPACFSATEDLLLGDMEATARAITRVAAMLAPAGAAT